MDGSERTVRFESNYANVSAATTVATFLQEEISSLKSIIRVSSGSTSALHQVLVAHNETDTHNTQYPFLSIGSTSGIGTFSSTIVGTSSTRSGSVATGGIVFCGETTGALTGLKVM